MAVNYQKSKAFLKNHPCQPWFTDGNFSSITSESEELLPLLHSKCPWVRADSLSAGSTGASWERSEEAKVGWGGLYRPRYEISVVVHPDKERVI